MRNRLNFVVDLVTLLVMWGMLTTGLLMKYVLPPGSGGRLAVFDMNRHEWGDIHFYLAVILCGLLFVHLLLHWQWVCATAKRLFTAKESNGQTGSRALRIAWGLGLLVFLAAGTTATLWQANRMVATPQEAPAGHRQHGQPGEGRHYRGRALLMSGRGPGNPCGECAKPAARRRVVFSRPIGSPCGGNDDHLSG